jgi:hypothetical protein
MVDQGEAVVIRAMACGRWLVLAPMLRVNNSEVSGLSDVFVRMHKHMENFRAGLNLG